MSAPSLWGRRTAVALALTFGLLTLSACSDGRKPTFPVRGRIMVDGKPAPDCFVMFHPVDNDPVRVCPITQADADGYFSISSYVSGDGAPAGEFIVTFEWRARSGLLKNNFEGPDRLKGKYYDVKKSTFRVKVEKTKEPQQLPTFELTTK